MSQDRPADTLLFDAVWWRADKPEDRAAGTLTIELGSVTLELIGNFEVADSMEAVIDDLVHDGVEGSRES